VFIGLRLAGLASFGTAWQHHTHKQYPRIHLSAGAPCAAAAAAAAAGHAGSNVRLESPGCVVRERGQRHGELHGGGPKQIDPIFGCKSDND
jgi:hypothetical protein